ncbi:MAG: NAD(P)/FAD-dependent oxidoreductase [bacterium]|nr:NAD(P)/FAD-dependent oxidoreductase [bacterium]
MEKADIVIIGAGVVGLAVGAELVKAGKDVIIIERNNGFGRETSSRNSEVIHAGLYYPSESLKAKLCVEGNRKLYQLCNENNIPYKKSGKIIVAESNEEEEKIKQVLKQGTENGARGLRLISKSELQSLEPNIIGEMGLLSEETGIVDTHKLMSFYEHFITEKNSIISYNSTLTGVTKSQSGYILNISEPDGVSFELETSILINCAGLDCDKVASMIGLDIEKLGYTLSPCKGEYFRVSGRHRGKVSHLIYPVPTKISLGLHLVVELDGGLKLGPNAFYVDELNYNVDEGHVEQFFESGIRYLNFLKREDLSPDQSGIRPKLQKPGEVFRDFIIKDERDNGYQGLVNLIGIESPGLTAAPAIADYVFKLLFN